MISPSKVTILMYHYVREIKQSRYPAIKGLEFSLFKEQLDFLEKNYHFITTEQLIAHYDGLEKLPPKAVLLTFDDGYADHFDYVFPELVRRKIQGSFFIPARTIQDSKILDVNKIHFILAAHQDVKYLLHRSFEILEKIKGHRQIQSFDYYSSKLARANRFDSAEVIFFKRLFQKELDYELRNTALNQLFEEVLNENEASFSKKLYLTTDQIKSMLSHQMHIGHHGYDHLWLDSLNVDQLKYEVDQGYQFLAQLGVNMLNWSMCYPYGAYNNSVLEILNEKNCRLGFCTEVRITDTTQDHRLTLPRLDTNDLPKQGAAAPNDWYQQA